MKFLHDKIKLFFYYIFNQDYLLYVDNVKIFLHIIFNLLYFYVQIFILHS